LHECKAFADGGDLSLASFMLNNYDQAYLVSVHWPGLGRLLGAVRPLDPLRDEYT